MTATVTTLPDQTPQTRLTPETYFGSSRAQYYYPVGSLGNGTRQFTLSSNPASGTFSLGGSWGIAGEFAEAGEKATLSENFLASKVFIILRPGTATGGKVNVYLDGNRIDPLRAGSDVQNSAVILDRDRLYNLVDLRGKTEQHVLRLEFETPGILAYTFTFG